MRIAMIIQTYHPHIGGAERQLAALAPKMVANGHEVHIVTRQYDKSLALFEVVDGISVHRCPTPGPKAIASLSFTLSAQKRLRQIKPDIVHAHGLLSSATTALVAKQMLGIPFVAKVLNGGTYGDIGKLVSRRTGRLRAKLIKANTSSLIAISDEINQELIQLGIPAHKRSFIPNGVDIDRFSPLNPDEKASLRESLFQIADGPVAVFSGRLTKQKRLDLLITAWGKIRDQIPNGMLYIVGTGEDEDDLKLMAGSGINFVGKQNDVVPYLQAADLFILPSDAEGLSNSMLEAMATALPVVATKVGAAPQLIDHGNNGWLIETGSVTEIEKAILKAFENHKTLEECGRNARATVVRDYSLNSVVSRLLELYKKAISTNQVARKDSNIDLLVKG